jgi:hypothetical protein
VCVTAEGERLRVRGPETERRPKVEAYLRRHKGELLELLLREPQQQRATRGRQEGDTETEPATNRQQTGNAEPAPKWPQNSPTETEPHPSGLTDPFAGWPETEEAALVFALLDNARRGRLPEGPVVLADGRRLEHPPNADRAALAIAETYRAAKAAGDWATAETAAADLLALCDWWMAQPPRCYSKTEDEEEETDA